MSVIDKLTELFRDFPGIGPRQAKRFVYYLLNQPPTVRQTLIEMVAELEQAAVQCPACFRFFLTAGKRGSDLCDICLDVNVNDRLLMVVEKDIDLESIRRAGVYDGRFFVLGGLVPILEPNPSGRVRSKELFTKILTTAGQDKLQEIIIALSASPEGDNTIDYLKPILKPLQDKFGFKVSILGRGLSTGTEIEYSDTATLKNALKNRA